MKQTITIDYHLSSHEKEVIKAKFFEEMSKIQLNSDKDLLIQTKINVNKSLLILKQNENFYNFLISLLQNPVRSSSDTNIITFYLCGLDSMHDMLKESEVDPIQLITQIASELKYEYVKAKKIMFIKGIRVNNLGDIGTKFYLIIKGKMNILIPTENSVNLSEKEYILYLIKLRKYKEFSLLKKCLKYNKNEFPINNSEFSSWLESRNLCILNVNQLPYTKDILEEIKSAIDYIAQDNSDEEIDQESYIKRIMYNYLKDEFVRKKVVVFKYVYIISLGDNLKFGEMALIKEKNKRTATIISEEDSHLGVLNKQTFNRCLYAINEKLKRQQIKFFLRYHFFKDLTFKKFSKKYFNFFRFNKIKRLEYLAVEGNECKDYIFLKTGEYQIILKKKSLLDINNILLKLGKQFTSKEELREKASIYEDPLFEKYMNEEKSFKISILNPFELVGFDDTVNDGKYIFSIRALSTTNEFYSIDINSFYSFKDNSDLLTEKFESFIKKRKEILMNRLVDIKKSFVEFYRNNQKGHTQTKFFPKQFCGITKEETKEIIKRETKSVHKNFRTLTSLQTISKTIESNNKKFIRNVKMVKTLISEYNPTSRNKDLFSSFPNDNNLTTLQSNSKQHKTNENLVKNDPSKLDRNTSEYLRGYNNMPNKIVSDIKKLNNYVRNLPGLSKSENLNTFTTQTIDIINQEKRRIKDFNEYFPNRSKKRKNALSFSKVFIQKSPDLLKEKSLKRSEIKDRNTVFKIYSTIIN